MSGDGIDFLLSGPVEPGRPHRAGHRRPRSARSRRVPDRL